MALVNMMEDARLYAEEGHIWEEASRRKKESTGKYMEADEFFKLANEVPNNP